MRLLSFASCEVRILPDVDALSRAAADQVVRAAQVAVSARGRFMLALAGGSTPKTIYTRLAALRQAGPDRLPWESTHVFFGDERCVPPNHPDSNFRMAHESMLGALAVPPAQIHRVPTELAAGAAAESYEKDIRAAFGLRLGEWPQFDLILLGLGTDGHTASLFPGTEVLREAVRLAAANRIQHRSVERVTLTLPVLNAALELMFVVSGVEKADAVRQVLGDKPPHPPPPARLVRPRNGRLLWMVDEAAARLLG